MGVHAELAELLFRPTNRNRPVALSNSNPCLDVGTWMRYTWPSRHSNLPSPPSFHCRTPLPLLLLHQFVGTRISKSAILKIASAHIFAGFAGVNIAHAIAPNDGAVLMHRQHASEWWCAKVPHHFYQPR